MAGRPLTRKREGASARRSIQVSSFLAQLTFWLMAVSAARCRGMRWRQRSWALLWTGTCRFILKTWIGFPSGLIPPIYPCAEAFRRKSGSAIEAGARADPVELGSCRKSRGERMSNPSGLLGRHFTQSLGGFPRSPQRNGPGLGSAKGRPDAESCPGTALGLRAGIKLQASARPPAPASGCGGLEK